MNDLQETQNVYAKISPREHQVVKEIAEGKSTKEIAEQLGIAINTVEKHRANVVLKMKCRNMYQVLTQFFRAGMLG